MTNLPHQEWADTDDGRRLLSALDAEAGTTRLVGGAVRDALRGERVSDIDLATALTPDDVMVRLEEAGLKAVPTGLKHGTVTAVAGALVAEITTLRRDVATDGRHADVAFTDDWREDAARRDFTINAMNARLSNGTVTDYFSGLADLEAGRVIFIGDPYQRIAEDHLRILRFFRFHERFAAGVPDPNALAACTARANDLMALSRERIAMELLRLLGGADPAPTFRLMVVLGIWKPVIPEFGNEGADRLAALVAHERRCGIQPDPIRRLAAVLPPDGDIAARVAQRLKLSRADRTRLVKAASPASHTDHRVDAYLDGTVAALDRLLLSGADQDAVEAAATFAVPKLPITGGALIERGLKPGPEVSERFARFGLMWAEAGFPYESAAIEQLIERALC